MIKEKGKEKQCLTLFIQYVSPFQVYIMLTNAKDTRFELNVVCNYSTRESE